MKHIKHLGPKHFQLAVVTLALFGAGCEKDQVLQAEPGLPLDSGTLSLEPVQTVTRTFATKVGINPFPYDLTSNAVMRSINLVRSNGDLYTVQLDNGIPWQDALDGKPFSTKIQEEWSRHRDWRAEHQSIYLAIAPLQTDRKSWAGGFEGQAAPKWVSRERKLTPDIQTAYINYVMRAVEYFQPDFINIGVEAMDLAHNDPSAWIGMETLFLATKSAIKKGYRTDVPVGMSVGLPLVMQPEVLKRTQNVIAQSDYFGISFYPHIKQFYDKIGGVSIPSNPPDQWRGPLDWARRNIPKPIAICETSYSSDTVKVSKWGLDMPSNSDWQAQYVEDLATIARKDDYLFVNFFLGIDYDALAKRIEDPMQIMPLWQHSGFFDQYFNAKPAWTKYQKAWLNRDTVPGLSGLESTASEAYPAVEVPAVEELGGIPFTGKNDLFSGSSTSECTLTTGDNGEPAMKWSYSYKKGEWSWAMGTLSTPVKNDARRLSFDIISDREGPLFLQVIEKGGEAFFAEINPTSSWAEVNIMLDQMEADPAKKQNGKLEKDQIASILLADGASEKRAVNGKRDVYLTALTFLP